MGALIKNRREKPNLTHLQMVKGLTSIMKPENLNRITVTEKVKRPYKPRLNARHKHNSPEADLRNEVILALRKVHIKVKRIENSITGKNNTGFADLWVVNRKLNKAGYIELKTSKGTLQENQIEFMEDCKACGINYWIVRSVKEAMEVII